MARYLYLCFLIGIVGNIQGASKHVLSTFERMRNQVWACRHVSTIQGKEGLLLRAGEVFATAPGYEKTFNTLMSNIHTPFIEDPLWTIERALELHRAGVVVLRFNGDYGEKTRFDIVTKHRLIACKNLLWTGNPLSRQSRVLNQELSEKYRVAARRVTAVPPMKFEIHSKTAMPESWKQWCAKRAIGVYEDMSAR